MKRSLLVGAAVLGGALCVAARRARLRRLRLRADDRADARERSAEVDVPQHQRDPRRTRNGSSSCSRPSARPPRASTCARPRSVRRERLTMAVVLAYVDAVPGRLYPLVATLLELARSRSSRRGALRNRRRRAPALARSRRASLQVRDRAVRARRLAGADALRRAEPGSRSVRRAALLPAPGSGAGDRGRAAGRPLRRRGRLGRGRCGRALRPSLGVLDRLAGSAALARRAAVRARPRLRAPTSSAGCATGWRSRSRSARSSASSPST